MLLEKYQQRKDFFISLEEFCHPLNFEGKKRHAKDFIDALKKYFPMKTLK